MTTPLNIRTPAISTSYGVNLARKQRAIGLKQNSSNVLQLDVLGADGVPVDLAYGEYSRLAVRFREAVKRTSFTNEAAATLITDSTVQATIPAQVVQSPGIFLAEVGVLDADDHVLLTNECYLFVENSAWGDSSQFGPPSISEVRISLRDNDPIENELIVNYDFDLSELCACAVRAVMDWNEQRPQLLLYDYDSRTFPMRNLWLQGTQLYLFMLAEEHYRRNHLPYSAGGISLDDKNRHQLYSAAWKERQQLWLANIRMQKISMNIQGGWRYIGSRYPC